MARAMTAKQRAALRKAQMASAAKRRGRGKGRPAPKGRRRGSGKGLSTGAKVAIGAGAVAVGVGVAYAANSVHKSEKKKASRKVRSDARKRLSAKAPHSNKIAAYRTIKRLGGRTSKNHEYVAATARAALRSKTSHRASQRRKREKR